MAEIRTHGGYTSIVIEANPAGVAVSISGIIAKEDMLLMLDAARKKIQDDGGDRISGLSRLLGLS